MKIKNGDLVSVLGEHDELWYGEIVGRNEYGQYEVFYISERNGTITYDEDYNLLDKESIIVHVPNQNDYVIAWAKFGFEYDPYSNGFNKMEIYDETTSVHTTLNTNSSSDESHSIGSMDSWSTSDGEDEYTTEDLQFIDDTETYITEQ